MLLEEAGVDEFFFSVYPELSKLVFLFVSCHSPCWPWYELMSVCIRPTDPLATQEINEVGEGRAYYGGEKLLN